MTYFPPPLRTAVYKTSDESRTTGTTYAADGELTLALATGRYQLKAVIYGAYNGESGIKLKFTGTNLVQTKLHARFMQFNGDDDDAIGESRAYVPNPDTITAGIPAFDVSLQFRLSFEFDDIIEVTSAGNIVLEWAQHTEPDPVRSATIKAKSFLMATRVYF